MALHVLLDQKLFRMPVHGRESLRGPLKGPPSIGGPRLLKLTKFLPQGVDAFPSQA